MISDIKNSVEALNSRIPAAEEKTEKLQDEMKETS